TRSANLDFEGAHTVFLSLLGAIFGSDLSGERGRLTRTLEPLSTGRRPGNRIALSIRDGDHGVVERRIYVGNARRDVFTLATANARGFLGHDSPFNRSLHRRNSSGYTAPQERTSITPNPPAGTARRNLRPVDLTS